MPSPITPLPGRRTPAPKLLPHQWWRKNIVVVSGILIGIIIIIIAGVMGSSKLLFLLPKTQPTPVVEQPTEVVPTPIQKVIGDVVVPASVGEDDFYLKPVDFDSMGMGTQSEIVLTSKADMDTEAVLFHLVLAPVFEYDITKSTPREIRIKPKQPLLSDAIYHFSLDTHYMKDDVRVDRNYHWGYETKQALSLRESIPIDGATSIPVNSPILISMNSDDIGLDDLHTFSTISPTMQLTVTRHGNNYLFVPKKTWKELTWYTLTIKKGMPLSKSSVVLDHDITIRFQTNTNSNKSASSNYESFIPDRLRITPAAQEQIAQNEFGFVAEGDADTTPTLDLDSYHGVMLLGLNETIPFEKLPLEASMDSFVIPNSIAPLWERLLSRFQMHDNIDRTASTDIVRDFFQHYGVGTPTLSQPSGSPSGINNAIVYPRDGLSITELLALIAYADPTLLQKSSLQQYFESVYFSYDVTASQRAQAAFGLASLGQPYLQEQVNLLNNPQLTPLDRLYLALGLDRMGATEYTVVVYRDMIGDYKKINDQGSSIVTKDSTQRNLFATLLTAIAGYTFDRQDSSIKHYLDNDESAAGTFLDTLYLTKRISREQGINYTVDIFAQGKTERVQLNGEHRMWAMEGNAAALKTMKILGDRKDLRLLIAY